MRIWLSVPALCFALAGCNAAISNAEEVVSRNMKDPSSTQFRDMTEKNGAVCGSVNSKNEFGAYTGFRAFVLPAGSSDPIFEPGAIDPTQRQQEIARCVSTPGSGIPVSEGCSGVAALTETYKAQAEYTKAHNDNCI